MQFYHCPEMSRRKPYGCGYGPVNATVAVLDLLLKCPRCGRALKKVRSPARCKMAAAQGKLDAAAAAEKLFGPGAGAAYLAAHKRKP